MPEHRLFQIVYDQRTSNARDPDFEALDNLDNLRPDWSEYWPIRQYLTETALQDETYYGFFSPRFGQKTGLSGNDLRSLLKGRDEDVVLFSPYLDQSALYLNQIEQGTAHHPRLGGLLDSLFRTRGIGSDDFVQHADTTVYSNFFVAKGRFWRAWLEECERVYRTAEAGDSLIGRTLAQPTMHAGRVGAHYKVFCVERVAGIMLATDERWTSAAPRAYALPTLLPEYEPLRDALVALDQLKAAAVRPGDRSFFIATYERLRDMTRASVPGEARPQTYDSKKAAHGPPS